MQPLAQRQVTPREAAAIREALAVAAVEARAYSAAEATGLAFGGLRLDDEGVPIGETYEAAVARLRDQGFPFFVSSYKSGNAKSPKLFRKMPECKIETQKYSKQFTFHIGSARLRFEASIDLKKYQNFWNASDENRRASLSDWAVFTNSTSVKFVGDQGRVTMSKSLAMKIAQDYMELVNPVLYITRTGQGAAVKKFAEQPTAQQRLAWALCADALRLCGHSMYNRP